MPVGRKKEELSVMEAVDNLSNMAEVDLKTAHEIAMDAPTDMEINWRDPHQALKSERELRETFAVIHRYLQNVVRNDPAALKDPQIYKGIQAIILIAKEAVRKMDKFVALFPVDYQPVSHLKEVKDLQKYYRQNVLHQLPEPPEVSEEWENDLIEEGDIATQKKGLRDLEAVRKDENYELFFIRNEVGKPYFTRALLRHIRLIGNFDELISQVEAEDPLLRIRELLDRELFEGAKQILGEAAPYIDLFYKDAMPQKEHPLVANLNKAVMALRMASTPLHLIENESFKSCLEYYSDFHRFLREAITSPGYIERMEENASDPLSHALLNLTHALCGLFFLRVEPLKAILKLIHTILEKGREMRGAKKPFSLEDDGESIRYLLRHYPNGPIMRTLDAFREEEEFEGFDPLTHHNFPSILYSFKGDNSHISVFRLPSPTCQKTIDKAEIVPEFFGFLRYYRHELKPDRHLLINLQDRTSWREHARCVALEHKARRAEFADTLFHIGLALDTDFYHQTGDYAQISGAPVFLEQFQEQLSSGRDCGFVFPGEGKDLPFKELLKATHKHFFEDKKTLTIAERKAFIDIAYLLITLKALDVYEIDSLSFSCKDGVDKGPIFNALFYALLSSKEERDTLLWLLYAPSLTVRERTPNQIRLKRALATLEHLKGAPPKPLEKLFSKGFMPHIID